MTQDEKVELVARAVSEAGGAADWNHALEVARAAIAALEALPVEEPTTGACDHYKIVSVGNGPWTCTSCGAVDPERPKYDRRAALAQSQPTPDKDGGEMTTNDEWLDIGTAPKDGTLIRAKRVFEGRVVKEGFARWGTNSPDAPMRHWSPGGLDGPIPPNNEYADTARWVTEDRRYSFPEPTHWHPVQQSSQ